MAEAALTPPLVVIPSAVSVPAIVAGSCRHTACAGDGPCRYQASDCSGAGSEGAVANAPAVMRFVIAALIAVTAPLALTLPSAVIDEPVLMLPCTVTDPTAVMCPDVDSPPSNAGPVELTAPLVSVPLVLNEPLLTRLVKAADVPVMAPPVLSAPAVTRLVTDADEAVTIPDVLTPPLLSTPELLIPAPNCAMPSLVKAPLDEMPPDCSTLANERTAPAAPEVLECQTEVAVSPS